MIDRILELNEKLQQNRKNNNLVKTRTAALDKANYLLKSGAFTDKEVAYHAKLPSFMAQGEKARIVRQNKITHRFLDCCLNRSKSLLIVSWLSCCLRKVLQLLCCSQCPCL
jgi:hypothetical protein